MFNGIFIFNKKTSSKSHPMVSRCLQWGESEGLEKRTREGDHVSSLDPMSTTLTSQQRLTDAEEVSDVVSYPLDAALCTP